MDAKVRKGFSSPLSKRGKYLLALPLIGTGFAGGYRDSGLILSRMLPTLYKAASFYDVDIALVCWDPVSYSMVQRQRLTSSFLSHWAHFLTKEQIQKARNLAIAAKKGNLVLVYGSPDSKLSRRADERLYV
eukprot:jgi/Bigna1/82537/fgenesh1_pg.93_\